MSKVESSIRKDSHAGSWYTSNAKKLSEQLSEWINNAKKANSSYDSNKNNMKAIIGPHAGYSYSGPNAAYAYQHLPSKSVKRIFLFGPSHRLALSGCALPSENMKEYQTPLGHIKLDTDVIESLYDSGYFRRVSKKADEDEHSLEMHLPYIKHMMGEKEFTLVPIMVGSLMETPGSEYAKLFIDYFDDDENFFVFSSDFCHWGKRFDYTYYNKEDGQIFESITKLDRKGMDAIESKDPDTFKKYLSKYKNTICGRNPIMLLLNFIKHSKLNYKVKFIKYDQSNQVVSSNDSSVSYASAIVYKD